MIRIAVFYSWLVALVGYLAAGAKLIPWQNQVAYKLAPKPRDYVALNAHWWAVPLSWFLWPSVPDLAVALFGVMLFAAGAWLVIWARRVNPFFLPHICKPDWVVRWGPYRLFRHPGYLGFVMMAAGSWLMLGHMIGFLPLASYTALLILRARRENRLLYSE
jgi:protein-S-isoprenylcysteine O-methyltransferase Ste14